VAGKKKVLISLLVAGDSTVVRDAKLIKRAGGIDNDFHFDLKSNQPMIGLNDCKIVLDDTDESLLLEISTGTEDFHYVGAYIDLD
jgi:hypothetical protein